jgi:hypothetical protein
MTDYFVRFNEYFPFLTATRAESPRLFYKNFSEEEHLYLSEIGLSCCDFAQDTVEWALDWQHDRYDRPFEFEGFVINHSQTSTHKRDISDLGVSCCIQSISRP